MPFISPPQLEATILSSETIDFLPDYLGWAPALGGSIHPDLCSGCSARKESIWEANFQVCKTPQYDCVLSIDGFYIFSSRARDYLQTKLIDLKYSKLENTDYYVLNTDSITSIRVDEKASELRHSERCTSCEQHIESLYGLDMSLAPPKARPLKVTGLVSGLQKSSCQLGAGFRRYSVLHIDEDWIDELHSRGLTGFNELSL